MAKQNSDHANSLVLLLSIPHRVALGDSLERRRTIDAGIECLFVQGAFILSSSGKLSLLFFDVFYCKGTVSRGFLL
jgi:hypothetical protein